MPVINFKSPSKKITRKSLQNILVKDYMSKNVVAFHKSDSIFEVKRILLEKITTGRNHLDIGCGTGDFLNECKKNEFIVSGVEPSKKAREQARKNFNLKVYDNLFSKELEKLIVNMLSKNQDKITQYKSGKEKLFGYFVGEVMKASKGKANPQLVNEILKKKLH